MTGGIVDYLGNKCIAVLATAGLAILSGCAGLSQYGRLEQSARGHYMRGEYGKAVAMSAASLKLKPGYEKAQELIQDSFKRAVDAGKTMLEELNASAEKFKWDGVVAVHQNLIEINKTIKSLPTLIDKRTKQPIVFETADYTRALASAKQKAANAHYQEGLSLSRRAGVDNQKHAAKEFKAVQQFVSGYKDSEALYEKTRRAGVKRIAIIPFPDKTGKGGKYGAINESIVDGIVSQMLNNAEAKEFVDVISRDQLEQVLREQKLMVTDIIDEKSAIQAGKILGVHEIVTGKITQIVVTPERTVDSNLTENGRVCQQVSYINEEGKERTKCNWIPVQARVTIYTRTAGASISGSSNIIEIKTAKVKDSQAFKGNYQFAHRWAAFTGSEEALSGNTRSLLVGEQPAPVEDEMVNLAVGDLTNSLSVSLIGYAR